MKYGTYLRTFYDSYSLLPHMDLVFGTDPGRLVLLLGFLRWELELWVYFYIGESK
jgi:hypothetical protein